MSIDQLTEADGIVFVYLLLENGAKPHANLDGTCDLDTVLHDALNSYQVSSLLLPLPAGTKRKLTEPRKPQPWKSNKSPTLLGKGKGKGRDRDTKPRPKQIPMPCACASLVVNL